VCGRFSQEAELSEIKLELKVEQLELFREFRPAFNIGPSYGPGAEQAFIARPRDALGTRTLKLGRWWLIPHFWTKPLKALPTAFNARSEELLAKPFWRDAFRGRRCLVPATGWREFRAEVGYKQPYQFRLEQRLFAFAGLWSRWTSPDGELVDSFTIITTQPSAPAAAYHDRMPLVLPADLHTAWLEDDANAEGLLAEARQRSLTLPLVIYPTNPIGNNVRYEGPEVVARFDPESLPVRAKASKKADRPSEGQPSAQQNLFGEAPRRPRSRRSR
jgi:putative SOS response-associated peptidase YedK